MRASAHGRSRRWTSEDTELLAECDGLDVAARFEWIVAADFLYEHEHAQVHE